VKVAILDWQIAKYFSPICDLSYFLFACISKEDIDDLDEILKVYHKSLTSYLNKMGTDSSVYPLDTFLADWKKYCKYGVTMSSMLFKICATDKDEVVDIAQMAESGQNIEDTFSYDVKDKASFKNRAKHVVKYVVENNLI
jgi:hypothetical protein